MVGRCQDEDQTAKALGIDLFLEGCELGCECVFLLRIRKQPLEKKLAKPSVSSSA